MRRSLCTVTDVGEVAPAVASTTTGGEMLDQGTPFAEFELEAHDGSVVRSADLAGHAYLIYFYPKAATPGCTREACELRDSWADLGAAGLKVFGVSYDSPEANRGFAEKHRLPFLLLSDRTRSLADRVGAKRLLLPFPRRISYLVGAAGRVLKAYPNVSPATHAQQVLDDFRALTNANSEF